eukprot:3738004-Lingulodinium_polyedra.AAC.1
MTLRKNRVGPTWGGTSASIAGQPGNVCSGGDGGCCSRPCRAFPAAHRPESSKHPPGQGPA